MAEDIAISVNDVSKMYKLYDNPMDRLKESLGLSKKKKYKAGTIISIAEVIRITLLCIRYRRK